MKYLKGYKMFESVNLDWIKELFAYLPDDGFRVRVKENTNCVELDFKGREKIYASEIIFKDKPTINLIEVIIDRVKQRSDGPSLDFFSINDVMDTITQAESYLKEELELSIEFIYVVDVPSYVYYKNIADLPKDQKINSISLYFKK